MQACIIAYQMVYLAVLFIHPLWGYDMDWDVGIGRWALRLQGHSWAYITGATDVLVR